MKKVTRTISGITPVAVMTAPQGCPGQCIYCPTFADTPQSYTPESPAVLRGKSCEFDAYKQVELRLKQLGKMGHPGDKVELIIMGGTFLAAPYEYQYNFIKGCFDSLNGYIAADLKEAQAVNETASHRCTGLCVETRPDFCGQTEIENIIEFGATRVEIGVQILSDEVYRIVRRGHTVEDVVKASALVRQNGLKVHYHLMPGLPGSSPEEDLRLARLVFEDERFRPDGLKLYPTMVVEGTELERWMNDGRYVPYEGQTMMDLIARIKASVPKYVRISRVLRDIPARFIVGGLKDSLRQPLRHRMEDMGLRCRCIRCREYGFRVRDKQPVAEPYLTRLDYEASGGREVFLSFEDEYETLYGLVRLRIQPESLGGAEKSALVRELHVYGPETPIKQRIENAAQHRGLGKLLLKEAERIAREEFQRDRLAILSGVGAREYYRSEGYELLNGYMVKELNSE